MLETATQMRLLSEKWLQMAMAAWNGICFL